LNLLPALNVCQLVNAKVATPGSYDGFLGQI
jgi:hypothetical protein